MVAEGAGASHVAAAHDAGLKRGKRNALGQAVLEDVGVWLCDAVKEHFAGARAPKDLELWIFREKYAAKCGGSSCSSRIRVA